MAKQIKFTYNDQDFTLEFTRRTVRNMQASGFDPQEIATKPLIALPTLFEGAFMAHHKGLRKDIIDEIYDQLKDKQTLIEKLAEMYNDPVEELVSSEGNVEWGANW